MGAADLDADGLRPVRGPAPREKPQHVSAIRPDAFEPCEDPVPPPSLVHGAEPAGFNNTAMSPMGCL